jgi:hypothetical protein
MDYFGIKKDSLPALVVVDMGGEGQMKKYPDSGASLSFKGVPDSFQPCARSPLR